MRTKMRKISRRILSAGFLAAAVLLQAGAASGMELNWTEQKEGLDSEKFSGDFVVINELGLKMWLPEELKEAQLDDEMEAAGYLRYYTSEDNKKNAAVTYVDMDGIGLLDYEKLVEQAGGSKLEEIDLNGLGAIRYELKESDLEAVAFVTEKGYVLEFLFYPVSDNDFEKEAGYMQASIMSAE